MTFVLILTGSAVILYYAKNNARHTSFQAYQNKVVEVNSLKEYQH